MSSVKKTTQNQKLTYFQGKEFLQTEAARCGIPEGELTGNMLVVAKNEVQLTEAAMALGSPIENSSRTNCVHFERLHVMSFSPESLPAVCSAASVLNGIGVIMRPERFVYAIGSLDLPMHVPLNLIQGKGWSIEELQVYLRGYRDACNTIYNTIAGAPASGQAGGESDFYSSDEWNLEACGVLHSSATGRGVRIAILDTGIDDTHHDLSGRVIASRSFVNGESFKDGHGHGTHCAGTASGPRLPGRPPRYGAACEADLLIGKVLSNSGRSRESSVLDGINWALQNNADIISMSLGAKVSPDSQPDALFEDVAKLALEEGCLIVAAAGNDSRRDRGVAAPVSHPANCPSIVAVGSIGRQMKVSAFSNGGDGINGNGVDLVAPGEEIYSSVPVPLGSYRRMSGTSMATPLVAGIAAMYAQGDVSLRGRSLWECLLKNCTQLRERGGLVGAGLIQAPR